MTVKNKIRAARIAQKLIQTQNNRNKDFSHKSINATAGEKIRAAREAAGLTQQEFGEKIGLNPDTAQVAVAQYEHGDRQIPRKRIKIASDALGVDIADLI